MLAIRDELSSQRTQRTQEELAFENHGMQEKV